MLNSLRNTLYSRLLMRRFAWAFKDTILAFWDVMRKYSWAFWIPSKKPVIRAFTSKNCARFSNLSFKWCFTWFCQVQTSTHITCTPVMGFSYWNPSVKIPTNQPVLSDGEELGGEFHELMNRRPLSLSKRSIAESESQQEETFVDYNSKAVVQESTPSARNFRFPPLNRTLFLNCTNPKVDCFEVKCSGGPFLPNKTQTVINFQLRPDLEILGKF